MQLIGFLSRIFQDLLQISTSRGLIVWCDSLLTAPISLIVIFSKIGHKRYKEAYSVAGEMGFCWWLVEHYLSYHVDCLDGCGLGEPARGG